MTRNQSRPTTTLPDDVIHLTVSTHTIHLYMQSVDKTHLHSFSLTKVGNIGKKPRADSIDCKMLVIYCERANQLGDFDQWVWWNIICWKCFIWDTKTMPKRFTRDRTSLLINVERFSKDFISKLHGYTIHNTQYTQSYCHLYCGWTPARNICISQPWLLIIKVHVKQRIIK